MKKGVNYLIGLFVVICIVFITSLFLIGISGREIKNKLDEANKTELTSFISFDANLPSTYPDTTPKPYSHLWTRIENPFQIIDEGISSIYQMNYYVKVGNQFQKQNLNNIKIYQSGATLLVLIGPILSGILITSSLAIIWFVKKQIILNQEKIILNTSISQKEVNKKNKKIINQVNTKISQSKKLQQDKVDKLLNRLKSAESNFNALYNQHENLQHEPSKPTSFTFYPKSNESITRDYSNWKDGQIFKYHNKYYQKIFTNEIIVNKEKHVQILAKNIKENILISFVFKK